MLAYCFVGIKGQKECSKQLVVSISVCFFFHQVCVFCVCYFLFPPLFLQQKSPRNHKWAEFFAEGPVRTYVPSWSYAIWWPGDSVTEAIHLKMVQRFLNRLSSLKYFILFFSSIASPFPFIQMAMFMDCGCQKHHRCLLSSAALFYLHWTPVLNFIQQK